MIRSVLPHLKVSCLSKENSVSHEEAIGMTAILLSGVLWVTKPSSAAETVTETYLNFCLWLGSQACFCIFSQIIII